MTNLAALSFLIPTGHAILHIGLMMAAANVLGSIVGCVLHLNMAVVLCELSF